MLHTHVEILLRKNFCSIVEVVSLATVTPLDPLRPYRLINTVNSAAAPQIYHLGIELKSKEKKER